MQGMGKPGSNIWATTTGAPVDTSFMFPGYSEGGISGDVDNSAAGFRFVNRMFPRRRSHAQPAPLHRRPDRATAAHPRGHAPRAPGMERQGLLRLAHRVASSRNTSIRPRDIRTCGMYYRYGGSFFGTMTETNRYVKAYQTTRCRSW